MNKNKIIASGISVKQQEVIYFLALFTFLTSKQIQMILHHKSHEWVSVALKKLRLLGYINEIPFRENNAKIFQLDTKGRQLAQQLFDGLIKKRLSFKNNVFLMIDRHLRIADIYIRLDIDAKKDSLAFIPAVSFPYNLFSISPDAYFVHEDLSYFLELDRETQSMQVWKRKFKKYAQYYDSYHWKKFSSSYFPCVCVVSLTEQRAQKLQKLVEELFNTTIFAPILFKFTTLDTLLSQGSNTNICKVPFKKDIYTFL